ncbi:MAG: 3-hydroxyacyl-CoA dehydrogenase NAD-binding domain-containing protein [Thermoleophilaceae bacterium]
MSAPDGPANPPAALGVVGAGTMGAGICQLRCASGMTVLLHDPVPDALERGAERARAGLRKWSRRGRGGLLCPARLRRRVGRRRAGTRARTDRLPARERGLLRRRRGGRQRGRRSTRA